MVAIQPTLKPITERQKQIGYRKAFYYEGTQYMSGKCFCRECGHEWYRDTHLWRDEDCDQDVQMLRNIGLPKKTAEKARKRRVKHVLKEYGQTENAICPNCRKRLVIYPYERARQKHGTVQGYFAVLEAVGKYQIIRTFEVTKYWYHGLPAKFWHNGEVHQRYIDMEKGDIAGDLARSMNSLMGSYCSRVCWRYDTDLTPKSMYSTYNYNGYGSDKYNFACEYIIRSLHPTLQRGRYDRLRYAKASYMTALCDPHAQTLLEAKQIALFDLYANAGARDKWPMMKICIRHGYIVKDGSLWSDTVNALHRLGMDTHSPVYICPQNLKQMHDRLQRMIDRAKQEQRRLQEEKEIARQKVSVDAYARFIEPFVNILLKGKGMTIFPLPDVTAFSEEGRAMHHCVYSMGYYKKHDRLILSCRDKNMKRLATIEYMLDSGNILQCRSYCNGVPDRDAEIRELIQKNRSKFVKALQTKKQIAI